MAEPVNLDPLSWDRMRRRREHLMDEITATPARHPLVRRPVMVAAAALSALAVTAGGIAFAATRGGDDPNPDADLRGGALATCDATWACLHPAAVAAGNPLLAPAGAAPTHEGSGVYYYDAEGSFVMNLVFHPAALPGSTATYIATRGPRRPLPKPTGGTPMTIRGAAATLQQWTGGGIPDLVPGRMVLQTRHRRHPHRPPARTTGHHRPDHPSHPTHPRVLTSQSPT